MNPAAARGIAPCVPNERELDDEIRGHLAIKIQQRIDRGEIAAAGARQRAAAVRLPAADARRDAPRLVQPLVRHGGGARAGHARRPALADAREGPGRHGRDHARARHRRQRRDLQRRPRRADAPARQSRRRAVDLHPAERAGPRRPTTRRSRFPRSRTSASAPPRSRRSANSPRSNSRSSVSAIRASFRPASSTATTSTWWASGR